LRSTPISSNRPKRYGGLASNEGLAGVFDIVNPVCRWRDK
jgi:hypothetical protein